MTTASGHASARLENRDNVAGSNEAHLRRFVWGSVTDRPLDVAEHEELVASDSTGAVVSFQGTVRNHDAGRTVSRLEYSAHPSVGHILEAIAADVASAAPVACRIAVSHRVGRLEIGDVALVCAVSTDHRGASFAICAGLVEAVKQRLPVWKFQVFDDGTDEWVGSA